ncbi:choline-phosphate cytidylyltransferase, partial [Cichlidogyrus casuarinus]
SEVTIVKLRREQQANFPANEAQKDQRSRSVYQTRRKISTRAASATSTCLSKKQLRHSLSEQGFGKGDSYLTLDRIGSGAYSQVFRGSSIILDGKEVALKQIQLERKEGTPCTAIREISLLKNLKHANIITLHDVIYTKGRLTIVMEYMGQDLKRFMESQNYSLSLITVRLLSVQLFRGLDYCHSQHILHRDIKPHNLLINHEMELKLADFGLARAASIPTKTYSTEVVTLW